MRLAVVIVLALLACAPAIAAAQDASAEPARAALAAEPDEATLLEARALFDRGRELADERRFSEAAEAFARSLELVPRPSTEYNLGACLYALGRHVEAIEVLERYVAVAEDEGVADARAMLEQARRSVSELTLEVLPEDAVVTIDGAPVAGGAVRTARLNPGPHVVRAEAEGHAPALVEITTARGEQARRGLRLEATRRRGSLEVEVEDRPDALIRVDGSEIGRGHARIDLDAGSHAVEIGDDPAREVELAWNERLRLSIVARPSAPSALEEPALWASVAGGAAVIGAAVLIGVLASSPSAPDGGSTGVVLRAPVGGIRMP